MDENKKNQVTHVGKFKQEKLENKQLKGSEIKSNNNDQIMPDKAKAKQLLEQQKRIKRSKTAQLVGQKKLMSQSPQKGQSKKIKQYKSSIKLSALPQIKVVGSRNPIEPTEKQIKKVEQREKKIHAGNRRMEGSKRIPNLQKLIQQQRMKQNLADTTKIVGKKNELSLQGVGIVQRFQQQQQEQQQNPLELNNKATNTDFPEFPFDQVGNLGNSGTSQNLLQENQDQSILESLQEQQQQQQEQSKPSLAKITLKAPKQRSHSEQPKRNEKVKQVFKLSNGDEVTLEIPKPISRSQQKKLKKKGPSELNNEMANTRESQQWREEMLSKNQDQQNQQKPYHFDLHRFNQVSQAKNTEVPNKLQEYRSKSTNKLRHSQDTKSSLIKKVNQKMTKEINTQRKGFALDTIKETNNETRKLNEQRAMLSRNIRSKSLHSDLEKLKRKQKKEEERRSKQK